MELKCNRGEEINNGMCIECKKGSIEIMDFCYACSIKRQNANTIITRSRKQNQSYQIPTKSNAEFELDDVKEQLASKEEIIKILRQDLETAQREIKMLQQREVTLKSELENLTFKQVIKSKAVSKRFQAQHGDASVKVTNRFERLLDVEGAEENTAQSPSFCSENSKKSAVSELLTTHKQEMNMQPRVIILGDSMVRNVGRCVEESVVYCYPGIRVKQLTQQVDEINENPDVVMVHVGTNDIHSSPTPSHIMEDMRKLVTKARNKFEGAKVVISGLIHRHDVDFKYISAVNSCLEWICKEMDMLFVDGNVWIKESDISGDGLHFNRKGTLQFGKLLNRVAHSFLHRN